MKKRVSFIILFICLAFSAMADQMAIEQIHKFYSDYKVRLVPHCLSIIKDGGALNCVSWNILANAPDWPNEESQERVEAVS